MHRLLLIVVLIAAAVSASAGEFQPLDDIRSAAIAAAMPGGTSAPGVSAEATLDPELRLPLCGERLTAQVGARAVAEVSCAGPSAWRLYVPVRVTRTGSVVVLIRTVSAGQPITADMLATETRNTATLAGGLVYDTADAIGRVAARTLPAGNPLLIGDLLAPRAVRRGEAVTLVARGGGVEVHAPGKALGEAGIDERVNVENVSSHRIVQGIVRGAGEVEVAL